MRIPFGFVSLTLCDHFPVPCFDPEAELLFTVFEDFDYYHLAYYHLA
jgi:hypothetical protein